MKPIAPTIGNATIAGNNTSITITWTNHLSGPLWLTPYDWIDVFRVTAGVMGPAIDTIAGTLETYTDTFTVVANTEYSYIVQAIITAFAPEDTSELSGKCASVHAWLDIITETLTLTDSETSAAIMSDTVTETLTFTDRVTDSLTTKQDYNYYIGTSAGALYLFHDGYYSDNGISINSMWRSKQTDFSDSNPTMLNTKKTVYAVRLTYVDHAASTTVIVSVSTDGGVTWEASSQSVGTGAGTTKDAYFYFVKTGLYFDFKVEFPSASTHFQFIGLDVFYEPAGAAF